MSSSIGKLSREEFRRQKDLDAARKAGTAPAELDEEGNAINPHIPQFMAQAPWYMDTGKPSLKHQRKPEDTKDHVKFGDWYQRGQRESKSANKYRKGACENCGAISHKTKDCLERPRKKGAKWTNKNIAADEIFSDVKGIDNDYEAKRDRWNGYDPNEHKHVIKEYEAIEEARRKKREEEIDKQTSTDLSTAKKLARKEKKESGPTSDGDFGSSDSDEEDEDKYAEKADMVGQKVDTDKRISVRNLRIREDRAKYLYNLNPESAYYDPKTRSMREAPNPGVRPEDAQYAGDNFERSRGDVADMQKLQMFAWQAEARGNDVHMQANPTVNELQHREYQQKKEKLNKEVKSSILDRYGGAEHFDSVPKELLTGQSESYVEYTPTGQPVHQKSDTKIQRAKSEEKKVELFDGNHVNPYGSWTDPATGKVGYECCHGTIKNSYCTGQAGKEAANASNILAISTPSKEASGSTERANDREATTSTKRRSRRSRSRSASFSSDYSSDSHYSSDDSRDERSRHDRKRHRTHAKGYSSKKDIGEGDVSRRLDKGKLRDALKHEDRRLNGSEDAATQKPDWLLEAEAINSRNKDKFKSLQSGQETDQDVTEEQLEAYRMKNRNRTEDPMANYRDEEEG
ncbi:uncharacterized protein FA14DRAFT_150604 [Meira miltonrushii]|uniref:Pre-mRNA-splicing factor SLU7 n=1 Tax=Meira miltonrushii TaxID=1280837 RepID=A0A316V7T5_9BASI|nr:uncharacterized protein FA14DRAFT_150604 [Meira miltonrushii]PWN32273.1 hypothetical protein FA14DRAFT_150604 [Meira miltonrushii]